MEQNVFKKVTLETYIFFPGVFMKITMAATLNPLAFTQFAGEFMAAM